MNSKLFFLMFIAFGVFCAFAQAGRLTARDHDDNDDDNSNDTDGDDDDNDADLQRTKTSVELFRLVSSFALQRKSEPFAAFFKTMKMRASSLTDPAVCSPVKRVK